MPNENTIYKKPRIEKFKGNFKEIDGGATILFTKTIQSIKDMNDLAMYVYLASKPMEWIINIKELMSHFNIGRDKAYKALGNLCLIGLIHRKQIKEKGKFVDYIYYLYLEPIPDLPDTVLPIPEIPHTYKEESSCIKRKESKKEDLRLKPKYKTLSIEEIQQKNWYIENPSIPISKKDRYLFEDKT